MAEGYEILSELGEVELDAVELEFLRRTIDPHQPEELVEVLTQLGLLESRET